MDWLLRFFLESWANISSLMILFLLLWGRSKRLTHRRHHMILMSSSIGLDVVLIGALVCFRNAIEQVDVGMHWSLYVHLPFAISCVVFYVFGVFWGVGLARGAERYRVYLRGLDKVLIPTRVMVLVTSILVQIVKPG